MPPPRDSSKFSEKSHFSKIRQNRLLDRFWDDLGLKFGFCVKNCIGTSVQASISSFFENLVFHKSNLGNFFTFDQYFEAWEHQKRTQHQKIPPRSHPEIFWPDARLEQAPWDARPEQAPPPRVWTPRFGPLFPPESKPRAIFHSASLRSRLTLSLGAQGCSHAARAADFRLPFSV